MNDFAPTAAPSPDGAPVEIELTDDQLDVAPEPVEFENVEVDGIEIGEFVGVDAQFKNYASIHNAPIKPTEG